MSGIFSERTSTCNIIAAILMVILLIFQFTPFWEYGENPVESVSIQEYIWFPTDHEGLNKHFEAETGTTYTVNSILIPFLPLLFTGVLGIFFCLAKSMHTWVAICPIITGGLGAAGFLTKEVMRLGSSWHVQMIICVALLVVGIISILLDRKDAKNND